MTLTRFVRIEHDQLCAMLKIGLEPDPPLWQVRPHIIDKTREHGNGRTRSRSF